MKMVRRCLKPEGRFLLQTIGTHTSQVRTAPWIERTVDRSSVLAKMDLRRRDTTSSVVLVGSG